MKDDQIQVPGIALWVSRDNGAYVECEGKYTVSTAVDQRIAKDANGFPVDDAPKRHLVTTIKDLDIPQEFRYMALVLDGYEMLYTIPHSMIKAFTSSGEIPLTAGIHVRTSVSPTEREKPPGQREWEMADQIKTYAKQQGKRVWVHCSI